MVRWLGVATIVVIAVGFVIYLGSEGKGPSQGSPSTSASSSSVSHSSANDEIAKISVLPPHRNLMSVNPVAAPQEGAGVVQDSITARDRFIAAREAKHKIYESFRASENRVGFKQGGHSFEYLPRVWAVPQGHFQAAEGASELESGFGYTFFSVGEGKGAPEGALPVVLSLDQQRLAVVTGALSINFKGDDVAQAIARDFSLQLVESFDDLKLAFYRSGQKEFSSLLQLLTSVTADGRVATAKLQIVETQYVPR